METQIDLREIDEVLLNREVTRRVIMHVNGRCDYCERDGQSPPCKHKERHARAAAHCQSMKSRTKEVA